MSVRAGRFSPRGGTKSRSGHRRLRIASCLALLVAACGGSPHTSSPLGLRDREATSGPAKASAIKPGAMALVGHRCAGKATSTGCVCRGVSDAAETEPPAPGKKRLEIRMSAAGGKAVFESSLLGALSVAGATEHCYYVDVPAGSEGDFRFHATADAEDTGVEPFAYIAEYGPAGPYWYDVLRVVCRGNFGRCSREGAEDWKASLAGRKRGRLDPCGSAVVSRLGWDTSGGQADRDGGLFRDFTVTFQMTLKTFDTQFAPGSTECVPK